MVRTSETDVEKRRGAPMPRPLRRWAGAANRPPTEPYRQITTSRHPFGTIEPSLPLGRSRHVSTRLGPNAVREAECCFDSP